jgi:hypothetical protein
LIGDQEGGSMRHQRLATVWISVADIRIGDRRRRSMSDAKVEQFRQRLEQGFQPTTGSPGAER